MTGGYSLTALFQQAKRVKVDCRYRRKWTTQNKIEGGVTEAENRRETSHSPADNDVKLYYFHANFPATTRKPYKLLAEWRSDEREESNGIMTFPGSRWKRN